MSGDVLYLEKSSLFQSLIFSSTLNFSLANCCMKSADWIVTPIWTGNSAKEIYFKRFMIKFLRKIEYG